MDKKVYNVPDSMLSKIISLLQSGENVTMHWLPGGGRTRFALSLHTKESLKHLIPDKEAEKLVFLYVDYSLDREILTTQLFEELGDYSRSETLRDRIRSILNRGKKIIFILDNFSFTDADTLRYLFSLKSINIDKIIFLSLQLISDFDNTDKSSIREFSSALHNIFFIPYFNKQEAILWTKQKALGQGMKLNQVQLLQIYAFTGGIPVLIKNVLRGVNRIGSVKGAISSLEMRNIVEMFWTYFLDTEKDFLKTYAMTGKIPRNEVLYNKMLEFRIINEDGEIGDWIKVILKTDGITAKLRSIGGKLIWNNIELHTVLSNSEYEVLQYLFENNDKECITREEIGEIIWDNEVEDKYSDWAIDKLFSRMRKNLFEIGFDATKIETLKGKGYRLKI